MRYDKQREKILIGLAEFVGCARRGISPTLPIEDDEPSLTDNTAYKTEPLEYSFCAGGYEFCLIANQSL